MVEKHLFEKQEKQYQYRKCIVVIYASALFVMFGLVIYTGIVRGVLQIDREYDGINCAYIKWEERYPFAEYENDKQVFVIEQQLFCEQGKNENSIVQLIERYQRKVQEVQTTLEWYCTEGFLLQPQCIELSSYVNRVCQTKVIRSASTLVNVHGGYITMLTPKIDTLAYAENVIDFMEFLDDAGIDGLYVESLFKVDREDKNPLLYDDYTNRNADELILYLQEADVPVLDLRTKVYDRGEAYCELFFKTDTHWLPSTGLWATMQIAEFLNMEYGCSLNTDLLDKECWRGVLYPNVFLGANGRNAGLAYSGVDDFELILPNYDTQLAYISEESGIESYGNFESALIDRTKLERGNYYQKSCYDAYMSGRQPLAQIYNYESENDWRILFISDSFGATVAPFLAMEVAQIDFLDPRMFSGSIETYIKRTQPDFVVMMYNPGVITAIDPDSNDSSYMLR